MLVGERTLSAQQRQRLSVRAIGFEFPLVPALFVRIRDFFEPFCYDYQRIQFSTFILYIFE